jgi:hypothetical protein
LPKQEKNHADDESSDVDQNRRDSRVFQSLR